MITGHLSLTARELYLSLGLSITHALRLRSGPQLSKLLKISKSLVCPVNLVVFLSVEYLHNLIITTPRYILLNSTHVMSTLFSARSGINLIQIYVFWDIHEPKEGVFHFPRDGSSADLVGFLRDCEEAGIYVNLRFGPYVCAEWNVSERILSVYRWVLILCPLLSIPCMCVCVYVMRSMAVFLSG